MWRALILGTLFAGLLMNSSWAQNKGEPQTAGPRHPGASEITFQWDYTCPSGQNCSFTCMGTGGANGTGGVSGTGGGSGTGGASGTGGVSGTGGASGTDGASGTGGASGPSGPGRVSVTGGASHVTKLTIYLGTIPLGSNQKALAVLYNFSTREIPHGNGFSISAGPGTLPCQVNGLTLDYSGPPHDPTAGLTKKDK